MARILSSNVRTKSTWTNPTWLMTWLALVVPVSARAVLNSTLSDCLPASGGYACGQCEESLQNDFNGLMSDFIEGGLVTPSGGNWAQAVPNSSGGGRVRAGRTIEDFLSRAAGILRRDNNGAPGRLNYLLIGNSQSVQPTSPGNPRVLLKSPDSELWISFNTDPSLPGYNKVEIQRWDGRLGRFVYQELDFGSPATAQSPASPGHADFTGQSCVQCHRGPNSRPNWATYRAWAGVIPPRDDFLEADPAPGSSSGFSPSQLEGRRSPPEPDANAQSYLRFIDRVIADRSNATPSRLDILSLPNESTWNPGPADSPAALRTLRSQLVSQVQSTGFYRIPHFPEARTNRNYSEKTSDRAGPGHLAFDQLSGQQMCSVANSLRNDPNWDRFKYAVAGLLFCDGYRPSAEAMGEYFPSEFRLRANRYFQNSPSLSLPGGGRIQANMEGSAALRAVMQHTARNHEQQDEYKMKHHEDFLRAELQSQGVSAEQARRTATHLSRESFSAVGNPYSAITDPGGVRGVAESDTNLIGGLRYLLEPFGVQVGSWSMTTGRNPADTSFSFSDQFRDILSEQAVLREVYSSVGEDCNELRRRSLDALRQWNQNEAVAADPAVKSVSNGARIQAFCDTVLNRPGSQPVAAVGPILGELARGDLEGLSRQLLTTCRSCHRPGAPASMGVFPNPADQNAFRRFLHSRGPSGERWVDRIRDTMASGEMPPRGWPGLNEGLSATERNSRDEERRAVISAYVTELTRAGGTSP